MLGGLVPPTLARTEAPKVPAHLGTTDVDVLLVTHLTADHDLGRIEMALETMQFTPQRAPETLPLRLEISAGRVVP